jgi:catechol 2,3-dioxygenase-like lactoylglutathione lyase family enzyme
MLPGMGRRGAVHHLELWVGDLEAADASFGWLLQALGYELMDSWPVGRSWRLGGAYIVLESGPDVLATAHERRSPGLNHVAFHAGTEREVDDLTTEALRHGWSLLFADRHPHAGGPAHYAAYLENDEGFEVELVASPS